MKDSPNIRGSLAAWNRLTSLGTSDSLSVTLNNRIRAINQFCVLCIFYAIFYVAFSVYAGLWFSGFVFAATGLLFGLTIILNRYQNYFLAKLVLIFCTNGSVILLSLFYGFHSGIHLYYFTSPLISFSLFGYTEKLRLSLTMLCYFLLFMLLFYLNYTVDFGSNPVTGVFSMYVMYIINAALSFSICVLLVIYFSKNTYDINTELIEANRVLRKNQSMLEDEIVTRKKAEEIIKIALEEKEVLLAEVHHRVKNNLAIIYGLMELQNQESLNPESKNLLAMSMSRIRSISLLHEKLYSSNNFSRIQLFTYIKELQEAITDSFGLESKTIRFSISVDKTIAVSIRVALPLGLILNELITNSVKHAFTANDNGNISIIAKTENGKMILLYEDNGAGFDPQDKPRQSLGQNLIKALISQLNATGGYRSSGKKGVLFEIEFKEK